MALDRPRAELALRQAVVTVAGETPISLVSVTELCRVAAVTRDTFYRYASSPSELLARVLDDDLTAYAALANRIPEGPPAGGTMMDLPSEELFSHIERFWPQYRRALVTGLPSELRDVLIARIEQVLVTFAVSHPDAVPQELSDIERKTALSMMIRYAASGAVGAIEAWLACADEASAAPAMGRARAIATVHAASGVWLVQRAVDEPKIVSRTT
ncbi:hypothetical protein [Oerskovia enterophila]|uniref:hypothetical protein n=1 Tax=Oerskovia enterophila TaxID=43678 RepID=UPI0037F8F22F